MKKTKINAKLKKIYSSMNVVIYDDVKYFETIKELITKLTDEDVKIMIKLLLGDRYDEIIDKLEYGV